MFAVHSLDRPFMGAPMAGGPSTPELVAAVANPGGLGFLAAGYKTADRVAQEIVDARALTGGPIGVNLFVVARNDPDPAELDAYRRELEPDARRYGVEVGPARFDDDAWRAKLAVVSDLRPDVVSFTFGCPPAGVLRALRRLNVATAVTVTCPDEADLADHRGAQLLVVQGPDAGAHRGAFDASSRPGTTPLWELVARIGSRTDLPVVASGGIGSRARAADLLRTGVAAVQVGTALLLADEAGTNSTHRAALQDPAFSGTLPTTAFTGRWARGLVNRFMLDHPRAPAAYPQVHHMTAPLRHAAAAAGDAQGLHLWAGASYRLARPGPVAAILDDLSP